MPSDVVRCLLGLCDIGCENACEELHRRARDVPADSAMVYQPTLPKDQGLTALHAVDLCPVDAAVRTLRARPLWSLTRVMEHDDDLRVRGSAGSRTFARAGNVADA